jgi:hypothetical protein
MPTSVHAILVIIAFIMPGFITSRVIAFAMPNAEPSEGRLFLTCLTWSSVDYALLSWLLVWAWFDRWFENLMYLACLSALLLFVAPVIIGIVVPNILRSAWLRDWRESWGLPHPTPKGWDYFFQSGRRCWVVATLKDGRIVAGWFGINSFASSFPHEEDIYLEKSRKVSPQGEIGDIDASSAGVIIRMENVQTLEFFEAVER